MKYLLCEHWGGSVQNVKKSVSSHEDDLMCWAAAASNVLAWTGWGFPSGESFRSEDDIFRYYQDHWIDQAGYPQKAWEWWFNGAGQPGVDLPGAGFWPSYDFAGYYQAETDRANAMSATGDFFQKGYGVVLELMSQGPAHYITCWGYEYDDQGRYLGIYVTDSDDDLDDMRYYELTQNGWSYAGWWYFDYFKNSIQYLISAIHGLARLSVPLAAPSAPSNLRILE
jgi:hypothetical protein